MKHRRRVSRDTDSAELEQLRAAVAHWCDRAMRAERIAAMLSSEREAIRERRISATMKTREIAADMAPMAEVAARLKTTRGRLAKAAERKRIASKRDENGLLCISIRGSEAYVKSLLLPPARAATCRTCDMDFVSTSPDHNPHQNESE
jgi:hypothetical protein